MSTFERLIFPNEHGMVSAPDEASIVCPTLEDEDTCANAENGIIALSPKKSVAAAAMIRVVCVFIL